MAPAHRKIIVDSRDRWDEVVAQSRERFAVDELIGMTVEQARNSVVAVGGEFQTDDDVIAAKLDSNRVIVSVEEGRVVSLDIG